MQYVDFLSPDEDGSDVCTCGQLPMRISPTTTAYFEGVTHHFDGLDCEQLL